MVTYPTKMCTKVHLKEDMYKNIHSTNIYNSYKLETTSMLNNCGISKMLHGHTKEYSKENTYKLQHRQIL
jgi:hypothetical protein